MIKSLVVAMIGLVVGAPALASGVELDVSVGRGGRQILIKYTKSQFTPKSRYRWTNVVLEDPQGAPRVRRGTRPTAPYFDPPAGGWEYDVADDSKYYWDDADCKDCRVRHRIDHYKVWQGNVFTFEDMPSDHRLKKGEALKFRTCLVDTFNNDKEIVCQDWQLNPGDTITYTK